MFEVLIWYRCIVSLINDCNMIQVMRLKEENCPVEAVPGLLLGCSWFGTRWLKGCSWFATCVCTIWLETLLFSHVSIDNMENQLYLIWHYVKRIKILNIKRTLTICLYVPFYIIVGTPGTQETVRLSILLISLRKLWRLYWTPMFISWWSIYKCQTASIE